MKRPPVDPALDDRNLNIADSEIVGKMHTRQGIDQDDWAVPHLGPVGHDWTAPAGGSRAFWPTDSD